MPHIPTNSRGKTSLHGPVTLGPGVIQSGFDYDNDQSPEDRTITKMYVSASTPASSDAVIELRNGANGTGDALQVTVTAGNKVGNVIGSLSVSTSQTLYYRVVSGGGLNEPKVRYWA